MPDSIDPRAHTLEKAVTFDLPSGARVHIFPIFNATYVGALPLPAQPRPAQTLSRTEAERYGLTPMSDSQALLPIRRDGGEWHVVLDGGVERTISWNAGDDNVTIRDRRRDGATREQQVPVGHELPLVPFR